MADIPKFNIGTPKPIAALPPARAANAPFTGKEIPKPAIPPMAQPLPPIKPDILRGSNDKVETVFPHKETSNTAAVESQKIKIDFQPNVLDNYDVFTYHWKLFITSLEDASSGKVLAIESQTIIAESGVSDLTIDKVEFQGIAVPSLEAGTGTQTLMKFEILEPAGAGLLDKMFYESLALGIGNWFVMPCFMQLEFRGRDPIYSEVVTGGDPGTLGGLKWVWPIKITNCKANVTSVGTKYEFDAIFYDELAQSNSYFAILHNIVLPGLEKFGKAMDELQNKLNADQYEKTLDNYSIPDTYRIVVDPELKGVNIAVPDGNRHTSRGGDYVDLVKKAATYNTGTGIDKIIDSLLGTSDYYQAKLQSSSTSTSEPESADKAEPMRKLWRIVTETKPMAYDMLRQDNAVAITIYIVKYDIGLIQANASQTGQTPSTLEAARKRLATYTNNGIMRKRYNYIFTGLNDQIISFDLNMNFSFAASLSRFGGIFLDTANHDTGIVKNNTAESEQEAAEMVRKTLRFANDPANTSKDSDVQIAGTISSINAANISEENKKRYTEILKHAKPEDRSKFVPQIVAAGGLGTSGELNQKKIEAKSLAGPATSVPKFVSDIEVLSTRAQEVKDLANSTRRGKLRPVAYREGVQEGNITGVDPSSDAGRARTSTLFSTALYSSFDASLMSIKLTIKGDPFWLFPRNLPLNELVLPYKSNMGDDNAIKLIKNGHTDNPETVNLFGTDNFIVVRFRTPRMFSDDTGLTDSYSEVETFSGVYRVISITSRFDSGKFTQELSCILDDLINLSDFPDFLIQLEKTASAPDIRLTSDKLLSGIPQTAIKTEKLKSITDQAKGQVGTIRDQAGIALPDVNILDTISSQVRSARSNVPSEVGFNAAQLIQRRLG